MPSWRYIFLRERFPADHESYVRNRYPIALGGIAVKRIFRVPVAVVISVCLLLFIGSTQDTAGQTARTFRMMAGEPSSLDPNLVTDFSTYLIVQLFEPMYILRTDGSLQMLGARSVSTSADGLTWTFRLNPAYKWSDGQPVTAADYEFSWKRDLDPKVGGTVSVFLLDIKNASEFNSGKITDPSQVGVTAVDNYTLRVTLAHPAPQFRAVVGLPYLQPVPKLVVQKWGDKWTDPSHIVSNGPYKLTSWQHDKQIVLDANPYYGGTKPSIKHAVISITSTDPCVAQLRAFEANEIDFATCVPPQEISRVMKDPKLGAELKRLPMSGTVWVQFDNSRAPWNDVRVRQALAMVVDRKAIVDAITQGTATVAPVLVAKDIPGNNPVDALHGSVAQAKQLLAAAGFPDGKGFPKFTIMASAARSQKQIAELLQQMWSDKLGVSSQVSVLEENAYRAWIKARNTEPYEAVIEQWYSDYADPQDWYDLVWAKDYRNIHYSDPAFTKLVDQGEAELSAQKRVALFRQANAILEKDQPCIALYYPADLWLFKPYVTGLHIDQGTLNLYYIASAHFTK